jgi:hypothetical protein
MADPLDDFLAQLTEPLSKSLVEAFKELLADPGVAQSEYAQRLRLVLEGALIDSDEAPEAPGS